jgi:hypothetical protein
MVPCKAGQKDIHEGLEGVEEPSSPSTRLSTPKVANLELKFNSLHVVDVKLNIKSSNTHCYICLKFHFLRNFSLIDVFYIFQTNRPFG